MNTKLIQGNGPVVAAKNIRTELSAAFPGGKFSVRTSRFAGGNAIDVSWTDGPVVAKVRKITDKYKAGEFNGTDDTYDFKKLASNHGSAMYVMTQREKSNMLLQPIIDLVCKRYGVESVSVDEYRRGNLDFLIMKQIEYQMEQV